MRFPHIASPVHACWGCSHFFPNSTNEDLEEYISHKHAFPGGNTNCLRHLVKFLIPESIGGKATLEDIHKNSVEFEKLDRPEITTASAYIPLWSEWSI
jgi:hypothetical protein